MKTVIEVGANEGQHTEGFIENYDRVFCFEPIPQHYANLVRKYGHLENFYGIAAAIDIDNGWKTFHLSEYRDWGCSSLHQFKPDIHEHWSREDFNFTRNIQHMMCMRLDWFMNYYGIDEVDYLHIDAQGNDLNVLKSLGNRIYSIKRGVCEAAGNVSLYDVDNTKETVAAWFDHFGKLFTLDIQDDGADGNEVNIYFERNY